MFPEFPDSRPLELSDKPLFDRLFAESQPEVSQYTFTNIFAWRKARNTQVSQLDGVTLVSLELPDRRVFLEPLGDGDRHSAMEKCLRHEWGRPVEFKYLSWNTAALFQGDPAHEVLSDRDNSDYLYNAQDLIDLPGRKYDAKRNFIKRFSSEHDYRYLEVTPELAQECLKFEEHWCLDRSCQSDEGLSHEREAVVEMLENFPALGSSAIGYRLSPTGLGSSPIAYRLSPTGAGIRGGAIEMGGSVVAFALGEALNRETLVVHVEKADAKLIGLYAVINNEFCRHEAAKFKYVNREQDLGIPGLRQAKQSYNPVRLVEAFRVR
jgi:hypothetical protein